MIKSNTLRMALPVIASILLTGCSLNTNADPLKTEATVTAAAKTSKDVEGFDPEIVKVFGEIAGGEVTALSVEDIETFDSKHFKILKAEVNPEVSYEVFDKLLEESMDGYQPFLTKLESGDAPERICLLKSSDPYDILLAIGPSGGNYDVDTAAIVTQLKAWDSQFGIRITGADKDWVEIVFDSIPEDSMALAEEVYAFCPDSVDQGAGSVEELASILEEYKTLFLWWD